MTRPLTRHQIEILDLLAKGLRNPEISAKLGNSSQAIKNSLARLYRRFDLPKKQHTARILAANYWSWPIFRIGAGARK